MASGSAAAAGGGAAVAADAGGANSSGGAAANKPRKQKREKTQKEKAHDPYMSGRFYERELPEQGDLVIAQVTRCDKVEGSGAYVRLTEYANKTAYIPFSDASMSQKTISSKGILKRILRVGRFCVCKTTGVTQKDGASFVDLSKRNFDAVELAAKWKRFQRAKVVHGIMCRVAAKNDLDVTSLCQKISWPLYKRDADVWDLFLRHRDGSLSIWDGIDFRRPGEDLAHIASKLMADVEDAIRKEASRSAPQSRKKAYFDCWCEEEDGFERVVEAINCGTEFARAAGAEVVVTVVAHPSFMMKSKSDCGPDGEDTMGAALEAIETAILQAGGHFRLKSHPNVNSVFELDGAPNSKQVAEHHVHHGDSDPVDHKLYDELISAEQQARMEQQARSEQAQTAEEDTGVVFADSGGGGDAGGSVP